MLDSPMAQTLTRTRRGNFDVWSDGTILPVIRGGSTGQGSEGEAVITPTPPAPPAGDAAAQAAAAEQARRDAEAKGIRKEAERKAAKDLADSLGMSVDDAKKLIADRKAEQEAAQSESEKAVNAAKERERLADEREAKAAAKERQTDAKAALLAAGIKLPEKAEDRAKKLSRATSLLLAEAGDDADEAAIAAAAETLKAEMPELFGAPAGNGAPSGDPSGGPKPGGKGAPVGIEAGRQRSIDLKAKNTTDPNADPFAAFSKLG